MSLLTRSVSQLEQPGFENHFHITETDGRTIHMPDARCAIFVAIAKPGSLDVGRSELSVGRFLPKCFAVHHAMRPCNSLQYCLWLDFSLRRLLKYWDGPRGSKLERMARHERGACPQRPVTSEKRSQTPQPAAARRVAPLFCPERRCSSLTDP